MENYKANDFESFKTENKSKGKNELLKINHQWLLANAVLMQALELAKLDNLALSAINEALIDVLKKHDIDVNNQLSQEVLNNYRKIRQLVIDLTNHSLTKESMELNAFMAGSDALTINGKKGGNKKNEKTNRAKETIINIWKSGKYISRDICAEQEAAGIGISFSTARKALINIQKNT